MFLSDKTSMIPFLVIRHVFHFVNMETDEESDSPRISYFFYCGKWSIHQFFGSIMESIDLI